MSWLFGATELFEGMATILGLPEISVMDWLSAELLGESAMFGGEWAAGNLELMTLEEAQAAAYQGPELDPWAAQEPSLLENVGSAVKEEVGKLVEDLSQEASQAVERIRNAPAEIQEAMQPKNIASSARKTLGYGLKKGAVYAIGAGVGAAGAYLTSKGVPHELLNKGANVIGMPAQFRPPSDDNMGGGHMDTGPSEIQALRDEINEWK